MVRSRHVGFDLHRERRWAERLRMDQTAGRWPSPRASGYPAGKAWLADCPIPHAPSAVPALRETMGTKWECGSGWSIPEEPGNFWVAERESEQILGR